MQKEIVSIDVDEEFDTTEVIVRVPGFDNFGKRLNEIDNLIYDALEADPELEDKLIDAGQKVTQVYDDSQKQLQEKIDAMPDGPEKKSLLTVQENIQKMKDMVESVDDEDEEDFELEDEEEAEHDIEQFVVSLPERAAWDEDTERKVDRFLTNWPNLKQKILDANFEVYKTVYPIVTELMGDDPAAKHVFPKPTGPEAIADHFSIDTLHLRADKQIGLSGHCTWDEEHGWGVLLKKGAIVSAGGAEEAFC